MTNEGSATARRRPIAILATIVGVVAAAVSMNSPRVSAAPAAEGDYIVVLRSDVVVSAERVADDHRRNRRAQVARVYEHALKGYAATMRASDAAALRSDPRVDYVEADQVVHADATTQTGATWGLDRIDHRTRSLNSSYDYTSTGDGVTAYIVDSGIYAANSEFAGRLLPGVDKVGGNSKGGDCNGHGTHVAGTVGGTTFGVAKSVDLVAVRVLDCRGSGAWSGVIAGLDWIVLNHASGPAVANMSLGGGASSAVDAAVQRVINDGVTVAVAAGNGDQRGVAQLACNSSPARVPGALTISATDNLDRKASWANYGSCVDAFAPGVGITSAWKGAAAATNTISGTSMAAPHVAGVAARYLSNSGNAMKSPADVAVAILAATTKNAVTSTGTGTPNALLFMDPAE